jgi:hypothetical protein
VKFQLKEIHPHLPCAVTPKKKPNDRERFNVRQTLHRDKRHPQGRRKIDSSCQPTRMEKLRGNVDRTMGRATGAEEKSSAKPQVSKRKD